MSGLVHWPPLFAPGAAVPGPTPPYRMQTFQYTGDGQVGHLVTLNASMDPDILCLRRTDATEMTWYKTRSAFGFNSASESSQLAGATKNGTNQITDMGLGYVEVGSDAAANFSGGRYDGFALQRVTGAADLMRVGTYVGNGNPGTQQVSGLSYQPDHVWVLQPVLNFYGDICNSTGSSLSMPFANQTAISIITFDPDGFTIQDVRWCESGVTYFYVTFLNATDVCGHIRYTGTGGANTYPTDNGQADLVIHGARSGARQRYFRTQDMVDGSPYSVAWPSGMAQTNAILDFSVGSYSLGNSTDVNNSGGNYAGYWWTEQGLT